MTPGSQTIYLACPHAGSVHPMQAAFFFARASRRHEVLPATSPNSLINVNCNALWCAALNLRDDTARPPERRPGWFAMLHSDVQPPIWWAEQLIDIAEQHDADIVSAVVPIKDHRGLSSTALSDPDNPWSPWCRLTARQYLHESFPKAFDAAAAREALRNLPPDLRIDDVPEASRLMLNTGCMVCRIDGAPIGLRGTVRDWTARVCFETRDRIIRVNGKLAPQTQSEDWLFTLGAAECEAKVMGAVLPDLIHWGAAGFAADEPRGQAMDHECISERCGEVAITPPR